MLNNEDKKDKIVIQILIKEDPENSCAKCCKTMRVIERLMDTVTILKDKVEIIYKDVASNEFIKKYGNIEPPVIFINGMLFTQGHVPIIKKLGKKILEMLNEQTSFNKNSKFEMSISSSKSLL